MVLANEMFTYVLNLLRQANTSMRPEEFNVLAFKAQRDVIEEYFAKNDEVELTITGLRSLRVLTDGLNGNPNTIKNTGLAEHGKEVFLIPYDNNVQNLSEGDYGYHQMTSIEIKICYKNHPCFPNGVKSDWLPVKYLRDVERGKLSSRYNKPIVNEDRKENYRIYYTMNAGKIGILTGGDSYAVELKLGYLKYAPSILLNSDGTSRQDPELPSNINLSIANRIYELKLGQTSDPRGQIAK